MNQQSWVYLAQLARALQQKGVDGTRAGEILAELDAHLTESGADPVEELGPPFELAVELANRPGYRRRGWLPPLWLIHLAGVLGALALAAALEAFVTGSDDGKVAIKAIGIVYVLTMYPASVALGFAFTRRLDGRSWKALAGSRAALAIVVTAAAVTTLSNFAGQRVVARIPAPVFWIVVVVALAAVVILLLRRRKPIRFPSHAVHLRRLTRGPLAGRVPS